jgi:hypothetical protein
VSFKVTKGDSVKIFYETTPPQVGLIERIPLEYSQRGYYYDGYTNETISYTYLNFAKYYECLRWYGTVLDVYAFEYPVEDCSDAPQCIDIPESPLIEFVKVVDETICDNPKQRGGFKSKLSNPFSLIDFNACYNHDEDKWQFRIIPENKILINYSLEICDGNLRDTYKEKLIYNLVELATKVPNDSISVCKAFSDILSHQIYGAVHSGDYYIYEVTLAHEQQHLHDFVETVNDLYFRIYYDKFLEYEPSCSEINNISKALTKGAEIYYGYMENYREELYRSWNHKIGKRGSPQRKKYENETQIKVRSLILDYFFRLKDLHPDKDPCEYCNVGCSKN